jgi:predicted RNA-binding protein with PUA domain
MMEQILERLLVDQEKLKALLKPRHEGLMAIMKAGVEEMKSVAEHQEVPKEKAAVKTIGVLEHRFGDRHLAVGRRRQAKKRTQGDGGSRKKLAAARRRMTRRTA